MEELSKRPTIKQLLEENEELAALLAGADLDTEPDENDTSALHARMEKIHRLIKHLHAFRVALRKAKLEDEDLSGAVEEKIKDLKKALKVLPAMEEARARPCSSSDAPLLAPCRAGADAGDQGAGAYEDARRNRGHVKHVCWRRGERWRRRSRRCRA